MRRFLKSTTFQMPLAKLESKTAMEGTETWFPPLKISHSVTQSRNQEKALIVTSSLQTHAAHQLWLCVLPPFLSLIQNAFLLITIILKVLKRINRWLSCASKGASRLALMALSNSSWYFIQQQIQFSSYKRVSIPEKNTGVDLAHRVGSSSSACCFLRKGFSAAILECLESIVSHSQTPTIWQW